MRYTNIILVVALVMGMIGLTGCPPVKPSQHVVGLTWNPSHAPNVTYRVYRAGGGFGEAESMIASALTTTVYTDSSVQAGQPYMYTVRAFNGRESPDSNSYTTTIPTP